MKRNIKKLLDEYEHRFDYYKKPGYLFRVSDIRQVYDLTPMYEGKPDISALIGNALAVGFVVGYHAAQRDAKNKRDQEREREVAKFDK